MFPKTILKIHPDKVYKQTVVYLDEKDTEIQIDKNNRWSFQRVICAVLLTALLIASAIVVLAVVWNRYVAITANVAATSGDQLIIDTSDSLERSGLDKGGVLIDDGGLWSPSEDTPLGNPDVVALTGEDVLPGHNNTDERDEDVDGEFRTEDPSSEKSVYDYSSEPSVSSSDSLTMSSYIWVDPESSAAQAATSSDNPAPDPAVPSDTPVAFEGDDISGDGDTWSGDGDMGDSSSSHHDSERSYDYEEESSSDPDSSYSSEFFVSE